MLPEYQSPLMETEMPPNSAQAVLHWFWVVTEITTHSQLHSSLLNLSVCSGPWRIAQCVLHSFRQHWYMRLALPKVSSSIHSRDLRGQGVRGRAPSLLKSSLYVSVELVPALRLGQLQQTWWLPLARALGL
jgi:hypothetical protein